MFEKHLKHYSNEGQPEFDGKIPIPFESLIFLTKDYSPIVNENGEIIIRLNSSKESLVISEKNDENEEKDIFDELRTNHLDTEEEIVENKSISEKLNKNNNIENENAKFEKEDKKPREKEDNESKIAIDKQIENDGFLTSKDESKESDEDTMKNMNKYYLDILNDENEADENFLDDMEEEVNFDDIEEDDDDLNDDFDDIEEDDDDLNISIKKENKEFELSGRDEAEAFFASFFHLESLPLCDQSTIVGSTVDLDEVIDMFNDNEEKVQDVFIKNLFAIDGIGTTTPDKIFLISKYSIIKAISISVTQLDGVKIAIENHLKSKKGMRDLLNILKFITANPEFMISDQYKPFEFVSIEKNENKYCKDNVIKLSHYFIEEIFPKESGIILKYPPNIIKISNKEATAFCEH